MRACVCILTDNLSTGMIVLGITCILIFVMHPKTKPFLMLVGSGVVVVSAGVFVLSKTLETSTSFRLRRVIAWLHPEKYASDGSYQTLQGLYAIGSGGFFGKGLGNSAQKMIIPEVQNDMILSAICEELGVFGVINDPCDFWIAFIQIVVYCPECARCVWLYDCNWNFCSYCTSGDIKCSGCD